MHDFMQYCDERSQHKISVNVAGTSFVVICIKPRINNVPMKKAQTLILTGFVPFGYVPKL